MDGFRPGFAAAPHPLDNPADQFGAIQFLRTVDALPPPRRMALADRELIAHLSRVVRNVAATDPAIISVETQGISATPYEIATGAARVLRYIGERVGPFRQRKLARLAMAQ